MRLLRRVLSLFAAEDRRVAPGTVDLEVFRPEIERYRRLGTKIGTRVRLLGRIDGVNPHLVSIGDYCVIGAQAALLAHCPIKGAAGCSVGNYVYLAFGVLVLPGVSIGDHCIVGAGSVVTRDIPSNSVAAGNPCRVIRAITDGERQHLIDTMEQDRLFGWSPRG